MSTLRHRHQQPRAAAACNAGRHELVQMRAVKRNASATRSVVFKGNGASSSGAGCRNSTVARESCIRTDTAITPVPECCAKRRSGGGRGEQHRMRGNRGMADETVLLYAR